MKIVLAVDGSPHSNDAVRSLAYFTPPEELTLAHAITLPDLDHPMVTPEIRDKVIEEIEGKLRSEGEELLKRARSEVPADFPSVHQVHQIGIPAQVILETAQSAHSDLIIIGARGLGPVKELVLGSVSHRVVLHAPCSVLVMKSGVSKIEKILLPVEGEKDAQVALKFLAMHPFRAATHIEVMTVWPQPQVPWPMTLGQSKLLEERALDHAQERLDRITKQLDAMNYQYSTSVGLGNPAYALLEQAQDIQPDIIVMSSHGRKGLSRFLIGSISHAVLHRAPCPVLIVR
ncbi:MAG: universal stress protein [Nitrospirota bacterium]|nr:MAG: universal stress protein [Nitrospirota bacterium]